MRFSRRRVVAFNGATQPRQLGPKSIERQFIFGAGCLAPLDLVVAEQFALVPANPQPLERFFVLRRVLEHVREVQPRFNFEAIPQTPPRQFELLAAVVAVIAPTPAVFNKCLVLSRLRLRRVDRHPSAAGLNFAEVPMGSVKFRIKRKGPLEQRSSTLVRPCEFGAQRGIYERLRR